MNEVKKLLRSVLHCTLASLISLGVYFGGLILLTAVLDDAAGDAFDWRTFLAILLASCLNCLILARLRYVNNEAAENAFFREYRHRSYIDPKNDFPAMLRDEKYTYLFVFTVMVISTVLAFMEVKNPVAVLYMSVAGLVACVHEILAFILHLTVFAVLYTLCVLHDRRKLSVWRAESNNAQSMAAFAERGRHR